MKLVTALSAILGLAFAIQRAAVMVSEAKLKQRHLAEQIDAAKQQRVAGHYPEAFEALQQGAKIDADRAEVRIAQEDVAMEWLRRIRVTVAQQRFTDIVTKVQPILVRGIATSDDQRKGDLAAHLGWADYLLWRDGNLAMKPEEQYRRALAADSTNPFAHAMLAHWILLRRGSPAEARAHFAAAKVTGRERDFIRSLELGAFMDQRDDSSGAELIRVANELRESGEAMSSDVRRKLADGICLGGSAYLTAQARATSPLVPAVSGEADLATVTWLFDGMPLRAGEEVFRDYCIASVEEAAGKPALALATFKSVRPRLPKFSPLVDDTDARIRRLSRLRP